MKHEGECLQSLIHNSMQKGKTKAWLLAVDALVSLLNASVFRCYILMYVSFSSHFEVHQNPLPILTNTVHYQFMMILDHVFQNGTASANCRLQVMPSSENLIRKMIFF